MDEFVDKDNTAPSRTTDIMPTYLALGKMGLHGPMQLHHSKLSAQKTPTYWCTDNAVPPAAIEAHETFNMTTIPALLFSILSARLYL